MVYYFALLSKNRDRGIKIDVETQKIASLRGTAKRIDDKKLQSFVLTQIENKNRLSKD